MPDSPQCVNLNPGTGEVVGEASEEEEEPVEEEEEPAEEEEEPAEEEEDPVEEEEDPAEEPIQIKGLVPPPYWFEGRLCEGGQPGERQNVDIKFDKAVDSWTTCADEC